MSVFVHATEADSFQLSNVRYRVLTDLACTSARPEDCLALRSQDAAALHTLEPGKALRLAALLDFAARQQIAIWQARGTEGSLGGVRYMEEFRQFLARHFGDLSSVDAFEADR